MVTIVERNIKIINLKKIAKILKNNTNNVKFVFKINNNLIK